jgi:hypothetical protein
LGFALGLMFHIGKNIWINVIAHFLNNALALTQLFYLSSSKQKIDPAKIDPKVEWWMALIALVGIYFLFRQLKKVSMNNRAKIDVREQVILAKDNTHDPFSKIETN